MGNLEEIVKIRVKLKDVEEIKSAISELNLIKLFPLIKTANNQEMRITFSKSENDNCIIVDYYEPKSGGQVELPNGNQNTSYSGTGELKCLHFEYKERKYCIRIQEDKQ